MRVRTTDRRLESPAFPGLPTGDLALAAPSTADAERAPGVAVASEVDLAPPSSAGRCQRSAPAGGGVVLPGPGRTSKGLAPTPPTARRGASARRRRGTGPKLLLVGADATAVAAGLVLAYWCAPVLSGPGPRYVNAYAPVAFLAPPLWVAAMARYRLYRAHHVQPVAEELSRLLHAGAVAVGGMAVVAFAMKVDVARAWLLLSFVCVTSGLVLERAAARRVFEHRRLAGRAVRRVLLVGADEHGLALAGTLGARASLGYQVVGIVDDKARAGTVTDGGRPSLGGIDDILELVETTGADGVIVSAGAVAPATLNALTRRLACLGVHVELSSPLRGVAADRLTVRSLGDQFTVVHVRPRTHSRCRAGAKRTFDIVVSFTGLLACAPLLLVLGVLIKLDSRGPVLFRQRRVGRDGRPFYLLKMRSMVADAEDHLESLRHLNEADGPLFKLSADPRVTRVGRGIRAISLDELPQLWNVLRGEMSLVGPRPALPAEIHGWTPELHERLQVRPGITGMWQVSGRSDTTFADYVHHDLFYVDNWTLSLDVKILLRTIPSVIGQRGAR